MRTHIVHSSVLPFINPAEVLTACLLLPGYSALSFSHYSAQKYEIKSPGSAKSLWELTSFSHWGIVLSAHRCCYLPYWASTQFVPFLANVSSTVLIFEYLLNSSQKMDVIGSKQSWVIGQQMGLVFFFFLGFLTGWPLMREQVKGRGESFN